MQRAKVWMTLFCWVQGKVRVTRSLGSDVYISDGTPLPEPPQDFWESERFEVRLQLDCRVGKQSVCCQHVTTCTGVGGSMSRPACCTGLWAQAHSSGQGGVYSAADWTGCVGLHTCAAGACAGRRRVCGLAV